MRWLPRADANPRKAGPFGAEALLCFPSASLEQELRCPLCGRPARIHQRRRRQVHDLRPMWVEIVRLRCPTCRLTWTVYPPGVSPALRRGDHLRWLELAIYLMGFSGAAVAFVLRNLGLAVSAATVYRDIRQWKDRLGSRALESWRADVSAQTSGLIVAPLAISFRCPYGASPYLHLPLGDGVEAWIGFQANGVLDIARLFSQCAQASPFPSQGSLSGETRGPLLAQGGQALLDVG